MTWLSGIIGQGIASSIGNCGSMAQQATNHQAAQQAAMAQQAYGGLMSQGGYQGTNWQPPKWMFNGTMMTVLDMANNIWPEDCADKTHFILKYSE